MTKTRTASLLLVCAALAACGKHEAPQNPPPAAAETKLQPTDERVRERAQQRMDLMAKGDWLAAYDFHSAEGKRLLALQDFLAKKDSHRYDAPKAHEVLSNDGKRAFVRVTALWTPMHRKIQDVKLEPGQSLTQDVELYQTWVWAEGDWMYFRGQSPKEFFDDHPDLLSKPSAPAGDGAPAPESAAVPQPAGSTPK